jgi:hypothetical protein
LVIGVIRLWYGGDANIVIGLPSLGLLGRVPRRLLGRSALYTRKVRIFIPFIKDLGRLMVRHPLNYLFQFLLS